MIYTYTCPKCGDFAHNCTLSAYKPSVKCPSCKKMAERNLMADCESIISVVDATPKTLGSVADRNSDRRSVDERHDTFMKHNAYRFKKPNLPKGMEPLNRPGIDT